MPNSKGYLSKSSRILVGVSIVVFTLFAVIASSYSFSSDEFLKGILNEAGQESANLERFVVEQKEMSEIISSSGEIVHLQVVPYGAGYGSISTSDGKIRGCTRLSNQECFADYPMDTNITLIVNPGLGVTPVFGECISQSGNQCDVTMNVSKLVSVRFDTPVSPSLMTYITSPYAGQKLLQFSTVTIRAEAFGEVQTIANVSFSVSKKGSDSAIEIGKDTIAPYSVNWIPLETGEYVLQSHLTTSDGWTTFSPEVIVSINESSLTPQCIDGDGGNNPFVKSNMSSIGATYLDNCLNTSSLIEFFCEQDQPSGKLIFCDLGCSQGVCLKSVPPIRTKTNNLGLLGWFSADEDPEFFHGLDSSANGKNLNAIGNISISVEESNPAYSFDGDSYAQITYSSFPFHYPEIGKNISENYGLSVSLWFNTNSTSGVLLGQSAADGGNDGYPPHIPIQGAVPAIYVGSDGKLRTTLFWDGFPPGDAGGRYVSENPVTDGLWHNVVVTYSNGIESVYLDGKNVNTREFEQQAYASSYAYTLGTGFAFGWDSGAEQSKWMNYQGLIDKFSIYGYEGKTLSDSEIIQLFNEGRAGPVPPEPVVPVVEPPATGGGGSSGGGGGGSGGAGAGSSGGGGVPSSPYKYDLSEEQLISGYVVLLKKNDVVRFRMDGENHTLTLKELKLDSINVEVNSTPQLAYLLINSTETFDLNSNEHYDLNVTFNSIDQNFANITLKKVHDLKVKPVVNETIIPVPEVKEEKENTPLVYLIILIVAVVLIIYYLIKRKSFKGLGVHTH